MGLMGQSRIPDHTCGSRCNCYMSEIAVQQLVVHVIILHVCGAEVALSKPCLLFDSFSLAPPVPDNAIIHHTNLIPDMS